MIRTAGLMSLVALKTLVRRRAGDLLRRYMVITAAGIAAVLFGFAAVACAVSALMVAITPDVGPIGAWLVGAMVLLGLAGICVLSMVTIAKGRKRAFATDTAERSLPIYEPRPIEIKAPALFVAFTLGVLASLAIRR